MDKGILFHTAYNPQGNFVGDFSRGVSEYKQEWTEGPESASFVLEADSETIQSGVTESGLRAWFESRLMWNIKTEFEGAFVWDGFIWELELDLDNTYFIKSMKDMANALVVSYTDGDGKQKYLSDDDGEVLWVTNDESILNYGRRERVITTNTESADEALERANAELKYLSSPYTIPPTWRETKNKRLTVSCIGRTRLANNVQLLSDSLRLTEAHRLANVANEGTYEYGKSTNVSAEILRIVELIQEYGGWLYPLDIATTNDNLTKMGVPNASGAYDRLLELVQLRDSKENFYRLQIQADGGVIYQKFSETPDYYFKSEPGRVEYADGTKPTWRAKPGIIRVVDSSIGPSLPDTWLKDKNNIYAFRTTMRDSDDIASFHGRDFSVAEYYNIVDSNIAWRKRKLKK